jgi:hypothetical protein
LTAPSERSATASPRQQAGVALLATVIWLMVFAGSHPTPLVDEEVHQQAIEAIAAGAFTTSALPMLPGYHWVIATASAPFGTSLDLSRTLTWAIGAAALGMVTWLATHGRGPIRPAVALYAYLPILFPFTAMVYTDVLGVALVIAAAALHSRDRHAPAAAVALAACLVRQSSAVWVGLLVGWSTWNAWRSAGGAAAGGAWQRWLRSVRLVAPSAAWYVAAMACLGLALTDRGGLLSSPVALNRPAFNIGNYYVLAFLVLLLWLPLWAADLPAAGRGLVGAVRRWPARAVAAAIALTAVTLALVTTFENWHPWNQYRAYLGNMPLIAMARYRVIRVAAVLMVYAAVWLVARRWSSEPHRDELVGVAGATLVFLSFHSSVDVRYAIVPIALADMLMRHSQVEVRRLAAWYVAITVGVCALNIGHLATW